MKKIIKKIKKKIANRNIIRIIKPHTNKSRRIVIKNFMKKDFKKIEKVAFDMTMLAFNAEKENLFGNVFAVAHAQIVKKPLAFFILNAKNPKITAQFGDFIQKYGPIIINPKIVPGKHSGTKQDMWEGSLSFPGKEMIEVRRYYKITVAFHYLTFSKTTSKVSGIKKAEESFKGFCSQLFQHEIDHTNGINIYEI